MPSCRIGQPVGGLPTPMVSDTSLPGQSETTSSEDSTNNTLLENPIVVSTSTGTSGGLPSEDSSAAGPGIDAIGAGFY